MTAIMDTNSYRFTIGHFEALVIKDTTSLQEWGRFFSTVDSEEFSQTFAQYGFSNHDVMEVMCLLVKTEKHSILIDTGWGVRSQVCTGNLFQNLESEGIRREEIDIVINSHGHPDHIGGNTDAEGQPAFPKARYIICRDEWDFWTSEPPLSQIDDSFKYTMLDVVRKNLISIKDRFELIDDETEIIPGFETLRAPGHTPCQIVLVISSAGERLFCIFDVAHHPVQFLRPSWTIPLDIQPEQAVSTRKQFLSQKLTPEAMVFACHFPFPGLGRVVPGDDGWLWQPATI
jgi:glyoxylase-like metal-dependent hydrolase (beta-lactamase superfamily II)